MINQQQILSSQCQLCDKQIDPYYSYAGIIGRKCNQCKNEEIDHLFEPIHQIDKGLYLGNESAAKDQNLLSQFSIQAICVCGLELDVNKYKQITPQIRVYKLMDTPKQNIANYFERNNQFIQDMKKQNKNVFIHCAAGVSRSASFVIAYIMKTKNMSFKQAYLAVKSKRKCVKPNHGFIEQLENYQDQLKKDSKEK